MPHHTGYDTNAQQVLFVMVLSVVLVVPLLVLSLLLLMLIVLLMEAFMLLSLLLFVGGDVVSGSSGDVGGVDAVAGAWSLFCWWLIVANLGVWAIVVVCWW